MNKTATALWERIKHPKHTLPATLLAVFLSGCILGLMSLYFSAGQYGIRMFVYYLTQPKVLLLNLLPFVLVSLLVFFLFNRAWLSFLVSGVICLVYSWAQYWKLMARNDPVFAEDLTIFSEALQMSGRYIQINWKIIASVVLLAAGIWYLRRCRCRGLSPRLRILAAVLIVSLGALAYPTVYTSASVYNSFSPAPNINEWFETNKYISRGGIYPFIYSIQSAVPTAPDSYDQAEAASMLAEYETDDIPDNQKVSVICVMYEAFADLSTYTDRITGTDPYEAFHALQAESYHGTLITNIFAGGTIDTERCVLTGFNSLTNFRRPSWSYARYFYGQGYNVNGAHAGYEAFYNRRNVNENLGIPDYRFIEGYFENLFPDQIPSDSQLLPDITEYCKSQMEDGPVFSFNVTYQNHGPYNSTTALFTEEYVPQDDLSDSDYFIVNNYLSGVQDTSEQMLAMADSFRDYEEPVVLVFFGDHKPWLGDQSVTYHTLGIDISSQTDESFYTYYATEYTIWANQAAQEALDNEFLGVGPTISPCYLMNVLFAQCGWEGPSYLKLTNEVMNRLPIVHTTGRYQVDGVMVEQADLSESDAALLFKLRSAQFYLAQDADAQLP